MTTDKMTDEEYTEEMAYENRVVGYEHYSDEWTRPYKYQEYKCQEEGL